MSAKDDQRVAMTKQQQVRDDQSSFVVELPTGELSDHAAAAALDNPLVTDGHVGLEDWNTDDGRTLR